MRGTVTKLVVALLALSVHGCVSSNATESPEHGTIHHVVLCWLKEPGNQQHVETIIRATRSFSSRPGIVSIAAGTPLPSTRPVVDDSFDVGLIMTFADKEALAAYLADPEHQRVTEEILRPLVERLTIYDIVEDPGGSR